MHSRHALDLLFLVTLWLEEGSNEILCGEGESQCNLVQKGFSCLISSARQLFKDRMTDCLVGGCLLLCGVVHSSVHCSASCNWLPLCGNCLEPCHNYVWNGCNWLPLCHNCLEPSLNYVWDGRNWLYPSCNWLPLCGNCLEPCRN